MVSEKEKALLINIAQRLKDKYGEELACKHLEEIQDIFCEMQAGGIDISDPVMELGRLSAIILQWKFQ